MRTETVRRWAPYLLFAVLVAVFFFPFFTRGHVLNGNEDRKAIYVPFLTLAHKALRDGTLPQWNPYIFCGHSGIGNPVTPVLYPPFWLTAAFAEHCLPLVVTGLVAVHFFLTLAFAHAFFRTQFRDPFWALPASLAYGLSTPSLYHLAAGLATHLAFALFPLLLLLAATHERRSWVHSVAWQSLVLSLMLLGGDAQLIVYFVPLYVLFSIQQAVRPDTSGIRDRPCWKGVGATAASCALALLVAAVRLLPIRAWTATERLYAEGIPFADMISRLRCEPLELLRVVAPHFFGVLLQSPLWRFDGPVPYTGSFNHQESFNCYMGVGCALLTLYAVFFVWHRRAVLCKLVVLAAVLTAVGTPLVWLHYAVTGSPSLHFPRVCFVLPVCFAFLMGTAGSSITAQDEAFRLRRLLVASGCALLLFVPLLLRYLASADRAPEVNGRLMLASLVCGALFLVLTALVLSRAGPFRSCTVAKVSFTAVLLLDLTLMGVVEVNGGGNPFLTPPPLFRKDRRTRQLAKSFRDRHGMFRACDFRKLRNRGVRQFGLGSFYGNDSIVHGYYDSGGYDSFPPPRIVRLLTYPHRFKDRTVVRDAFPITEQALELTGTRTLVDKDGIVKTFAKAIPRFAVFTRFVVEPDPDRALKLLFTGPMEYASTVLLDRLPALGISPAQAGGTVALLREDFDELELQVAAPANCVLLVTDTYAPGWTATVDDKPTGILRANYAFRAVAVPAGEHTVRFRFVHEGLRTGAVLTALGLVILMGLGVVAAWRRRQERFARGSPGEPPLP